MEGHAGAWARGHVGGTWGDWRGRRGRGAVLGDVGPSCGGAQSMLRAPECCTLSCPGTLSKQADERVLPRSAPRLAVLGAGSFDST